MGATADPIEAEIELAAGLCRDLISEYVSWGWKTSAIHQALYSDIADFANFRIETADTCVLLAENNRVADALGLSRSLLEHYLLLMLMCRGTRYFRVEDLSNSNQDFATALARRQKERDLKFAAGESAYLSVSKYPRASRHIMHVFEGLSSTDEPDLRVPVHYFAFQNFRPETMRLKDADYFTYYPDPTEVVAARKKHRAEAIGQYRHYLSYDALLQCLALNDLLDIETEKRVQAHYTFLGRFVHPTHDAARDLGTLPNHHGSGTALGLSRPYAGAARLLALCYAGHLLAGITDEVCALIENAPSRFIAAANTAPVRRAAEEIRSTLDYFWFVFGEPAAYDRFNFACAHLKPADRERIGSYLAVPAADVPFDMHIYSRFSNAINGWNNRLWGSYASPVFTRRR